MECRVNAGGGLTIPCRVTASAKIAAAAEARNLKVVRVDAARDPYFPALAKGVFANSALGKGILGKSLKKAVIATQEYLPSTICCGVSSTLDGFLFL